MPPATKRHTTTSPHFQVGVTSSGCEADLLSNAVKFTDQGLIQVKASLDSQGPRWKQLTVEVADSGEGIPRNKINTIFEMFKQGASHLTRRHKGTGLGLTICRRLVELMDGEIWVESHPGVGSTFFFTARVQIDEAAILGGQRTQFEAKKPMVWVIDEEEHRGSQLRDSIAAWDYAVGYFDRIPDSVNDSGSSSSPAVILISSEKELAAQGMFEKVATLFPSDLPSLLFLADDSDPFPGPVKSEQYQIEFDKLRTPITLSDLQRHLGQLLERKRQRRKEDHAQLSLESNEANRRKILLAEDEPVNAEVTRTILERAGFEVICVANGKKAVQTATNSESSFDLIIMDVMMPRMSGIEATQIIRKNEYFLNKRTPIIALTASATNDDRDECMAVGMDDYITKPLNRNKLISCVERVLNEREHDLNRRDLYSSIWNPEFLLEECGELSSMKRILRIFLDHRQENMEQIAKGVESQELELLFHSVHRLKGALKSIGAHNLADHAETLESLAQGKGDGTLISEEFATLQKEVEVLSNCILEFLDSNSSR